MSRLEQAEQHVDAALDQLEAALGRVGQGTETKTAKLERRLAVLRQEYSVLDETTSTVAVRLDAAIDRLETVVGE